MSDASVLDRIYRVICDRRRERPDGSYVVSLLDGGHDAISAKVMEEAGELVEAARANDRDHAAHESADLLFHALVLMASIDVPPSAVYAKLEERFGTGGLVEKAARGAAG